MRPQLRDASTAPATEAGALQETVAGLHAVVMLGSFMHAAPRSADTAELSVGGLAALTRMPLAAVAWRAEGEDAPLRVVGRCGGERGLSAEVAKALRRMCEQLPELRPSRLRDGQLPSTLRLAGLHVLLAVPLRVSTECLGFLLVGGERGALPDDLTLIQALGAQTSTALYVARLHETEVARLRELGDLATELREQGDLLSRALRLQEELIDLVLRGKNARTIVEHLAQQIRAPVWLLDGDRRPVAHAAGDAGQRGRLPRKSELRRVLGPQHPDRDPRAVEMSTSGGVQSFLVQTVATDRETFGYLLVGSTALGPVDHTTFQGGRLVLALRLLIERSVAEAEERAGRDLLQDVLLRRGGAMTSAAVAARLGYDERGGPAAVLAVRPRPRPDGGARLETARPRAVAAVRDELRSDHRALVGAIGEDIVVIVRAEAATACAARIRDRLRTTAPELRVSIGISDPRPDVGDLEPAYREAVTAAALGERGPAGVLSFADLGLHRLLFDTANADRVGEHVERWIGPLLRYDEAHRSQLVETLGCVLAGDGQRAVAEALSIHPSTLKYRLGRIREILDLDLGDADVRFNVELAVRLRDSVRSIPTVSSG